MWRTHSTVDSVLSETFNSQHESHHAAKMAQQDKQDDEASLAQPEIVLPVLVRFHRGKKGPSAKKLLKAKGAAKTKRSSFQTYLAPSGDLVVFPLSGTTGSPDSCFFMACLAPSNDSAFAFLEQQPHLTPFVFVMDEKAHQLFLTGFVCGQKRVISLYNKELLKLHQIQVEWDLGRDRVKLKQDEIHHKTRYHVLTVASPGAFDKLQFLWRNFIPGFQLFAYEMSRHMFFQIESAAKTAFNLKEWFLAIVASAGSENFAPNSMRSPTNRSKKRDSVTNSLVHAVQATQMGPVQDQQQQNQPPQPQAPIHGVPVARASQTGLLRSIKSKTDVTDTSQVVSILLRGADAKHHGECVFYMAKKVIFRDPDNPMHPRFRYPLRIIRFDFRQLRIFISDTYYDPTSHVFWRLWSVVEDKTDYEISIKQLSFSELYKSFVASRCLAPRRFSVIRLASLLAPGGTSQIPIVLKQQNASVVLRQSLRRSLVTNHAANHAVEGKLDDYQQFFDHALQAFDFVNPSRRIPLQFRKLLQDFIILLCQEEFRHATFSSETSQLRCRITDYLTEFLAATSTQECGNGFVSGSSANPRCPNCDAGCNPTNAPHGSSATAPTTPTTTPATTSGHMDAGDATRQEHFEGTIPLFQKYLRLSIAVLITRSSDEEFFVVYRCINKIWSQLYDANQLISCQIWLLLMELVSLDTLCRDYVLEKAHEMFQGDAPRGPSCFLHVNPSSFRRFVTNHLDLTHLTLDQWELNLKSLVLQEPFQRQALETTLAVNDVLRYELIVALAQSLFIDVADGITIDHKAATILNYPKIHETLFKRILEWTQLGQNPMSSHVLQVLWQCVSVFHRLETYAKNFVDEQMAFSVAFCDELVRKHYDVVSPASCALFVMMEEYLERMGSNRVDEFILICIENLVQFVSSLADKLVLWRDLEHDRGHGHRKSPSPSTSTRPTPEPDQDASFAQETTTTLLVETSFHLITIWKLLISKAKSRSLRELVLRVLNEDCFAMFQFLETLISKLHHDQKGEYTVLVHRLFDLIEAFLEYEQGAHTMPCRSMIGSMEDNMLAQDMTLLMSHFVGIHSSTGRSFWHLLVEFLIFTSSQAIYAMQPRFLGLLFEIYLHQIPLVAAEDHFRDRLVKFHAEVIQNHFGMLKSQDGQDQAAAGDQDNASTYEALNIHLDCLIVLAETSEFYESFVRSGIAPLFVQLLTEDQATAEASAAATAEQKRKDSNLQKKQKSLVSSFHGHPGIVRNKSIARLPIETSPSASLTSAKLTRKDTDEKSASSKASASNKDWCERLEALVVVLVLIITTPAPLYEFDPRVCPRFCVEATHSIDLLYQLQKFFKDADTHQHRQQQHHHHPQNEPPHHHHHHPQNAHHQHQKACDVLDIMQEFRVNDILSSERCEKLLILIKLLGGIGYSPEKFGKREYTNKGAFGSVYRAVTASNVVVAIKQLNFQLHPMDRSVVHDIYNELGVLLHLKARASLSSSSPTDRETALMDPMMTKTFGATFRRRISQPAVIKPWIRLYDYGTANDLDCFDVVSEWCFGSLKELRVELNLSELSVLHKDFVLIRVFEMVCECLGQLHAGHVLHLDVKCANVLLRKESREIITHIWMETRGFEASRASEFLAFGDFGEALVIPGAPTCSSQQQQQLHHHPHAPHHSMDPLDLIRVQASPKKPTGATRTCTSPGISPATHCVRIIDRTRGTEPIKSPEMLYIAEVKNRESEPGALSFVGQPRVVPTISSASDIWSLGCLLYEWLVEDFLFGTDQYAAFYSHLVKSQSNVVRHEHKDKLLAHLEPSHQLHGFEEQKADHQNFLTASLQLLELILQRNPEERPSLDAVVDQVRCLVDQLRTTLVTKF